MAIEASLLKLFGALEESGIRYSLLRGFEELAQVEPVKEIDLLVAPSQRAEFSRIAARCGFMEAPRWGYEPHYFYVAYDREAAAWLKLDVVAELAYGKLLRWLPVDLAEQCLARRQQAKLAESLTSTDKSGEDRQAEIANGKSSIENHQSSIANLRFTYVLSPADEFTTLFLHCLLDKGMFRDARRERLLALKNRAEKEREIKETILKNFQPYLPAGVSWQTIGEIIQETDRKALTKHRKAFSGRLFRRHPLGSLARNLRTRLMRRLRTPLFMMRRRGLWIALLAPDGAGKTTLAHSLLKEQFLRARLIYMGTNLDSSTVGFPTSKWLKKRIKMLESRKSPLNKLLLKALKMANYLNRLLEQWYRVGAGIYYKWSGRTVVFDRFIYDAYLAAPARTAGQKLRRWLIRSACPPADVTYLLDAPGEMLFRRKGEHSPEILEKQRQTFLSLRDKIPNMVIVDATRSADQVRSDILSDIWKIYRLRVSRNGTHESESD